MYAIGKGQGLLLAALGGTTMLYRKPTSLPAMPRHVASKLDLDIEQVSFSIVKNKL